MKAKIVTIGLIIALFWGCGYFEHHYTRSGVVTLADDDSIEVTDTCGYIWGLYGDDVAVGDEVVLKMYDAGTRNVYDDEVLDYVVIEKEAKNEK